MSVSRSEFEAAYRAWMDRVNGDTRILLSSFQESHVELPEYDAIVALGPDALPFVMERLEAGDVLLNDAALRLLGVRYEDVVPDPAALYSEQELAEFLLDRWRSAPAP